MDLVFDTNIILAYMKGEAAIMEAIREELILPPPLPQTLIISIVTVAEIRAFGLKRDWIPRKVQAAESYMKKLLQVPIDSTDLIGAYAEIDAYSQGKLVGRPLPKGMTSRNMGKNDLWIAATAAVTKATIVTTDGDFSHLPAFGIGVKNYSHLLPTASLKKTKGAGR